MRHLFVFFPFSLSFLLEKRLDRGACCPCMVVRRGYRGYGKFLEESDNDVGSDNENCQVVKSTINDHLLQCFIALLL